MDELQQAADWTRDARGVSNSSAAFAHAVDAVFDILRHHRLDSDLRDTSRLIVALLAHVHGFAPRADVPPSPSPGFQKTREQIG